MTWSLILQIIQKQHILKCIFQKYICPNPMIQKYVFNKQKNCLFSTIIFLKVHFPTHVFSFNFCEEESSGSKFVCLKAYSAISETLVSQTKLNQK